MSKKYKDHYLSVEVIVAVTQREADVVQTGAVRKKLIALVE